MSGLLVFSNLFKKHRFSILLFLVFLGCFFWTATTVDPDFGWHLQSGKVMLQSGIPTRDPFSYTMPSFLYVDHSWAIDIVTVLLFNKGGFLLLSLFVALISTLVFWVSSRVERFSHWTLLPATLCGAVLVEFVGMRPFVLSWLLFSVVLLICWEDTRWNRFKVTLPILFLVWANSHGGFASGLFVVGIRVVTNWWTQKSLPTRDVGLLLACSLVTLINPYHLGLWKEVVTTLGSSPLRASIAEWTPGIYYFDTVTATLGVLATMMLVRFRNFFTLYQKIIFVLLLVAAITTLRQIPFLAIISVPVISKGLLLFSRQVKAVKYGTARFGTGFRVLVILIVVFISSTMYHRFKSSDFINAEKYYPNEAISFLKNSPIQGNVFAPYNWGGYLIWQLPEKKTFVDGRMSVWENETAPPNESINAFRDYKNILSGSTDYHAIFAKFRISTVLWQKSSLVVTRPKAASLNTFLVSLVISQENHVDDPLLIRLERDGWKIIYEDDTATIYQDNSLQQVQVLE